MEAPKLISSKRVCEFPPGDGNPRNSEGDFLRLADGRLMFAYSKYIADSGHDDAPCGVGCALSDDNGRTWTKMPGLLIAPDEHDIKNMMSGSLVRYVTD